MSRDNLASMRVPNVAGSHLPGLAALGITPMALQGVASSYLSRHIGNNISTIMGRARLNRLRATARRG